MSVIRPFALTVSKPQRVLFLSAVGFIALVTAILLLQRPQVFTLLPVKEVAPKIGALAPDFALKDVDGKTVRLADFRGKNPVFLNFWASWCPACRQEAPENEKLHQRLGPKGLKFLAVSIDRGPGALDEVRKFMEEFKLSFRPLLDSNGELFEQYRVTAIPTTFLIDREGKIVATEIGPKNWTSSEKLNRIAALVNEQNGSKLYVGSG